MSVGSEGGVQPNWDNLASLRGQFVRVEGAAIQESGERIGARQMLQLGAGNRLLDGDADLVGDDRRFDARTRRFLVRGWIVDGVGRPTRRGGQRVCAGDSN